MVIAFIAVFVVVALAALWINDSSPEGRDYKRAFTALAGLWAILGLRKWGPPLEVLWRDWDDGLRLYGLLCGLIVLALATIFLDEIGTEVRRLESDKTGLSFVPHWLWGCVQQGLLLAFLAHTTQSALWPAIIFAILHLPNKLLSPLTFVAGYASAFIYLSLDIKAILVAGTLHATLSFLVATYLPKSLNQGMSVGRDNWERYWRRNG